MEAQSAGHMEQLFSCRNCERWGSTLPAGKYSQMVLLPLQLPKGSSLRKEWRSGREACACVCLWLWEGGAHKAWEARRMEENGEKQNTRVSPAFFPTSLVIDRVLTFVTEEWGSVRMMCICHWSWWKHPEHWWIWRVHPDKWLLKREIWEEFLKLFYCFEKKKNVIQALHRIKIIICPSYAFHLHPAGW